MSEEALGQMAASIVAGIVVVREILEKWGPSRERKSTEPSAMSLLENQLEATNTHLANLIEALRQRGTP